MEIDDCSLEWTRAQGIGGWPWPRTVHADLLDTLDRAGVRAVGVDVMFLDPHKDDPDGDAMLDAVAAGGNGPVSYTHLDVYKRQCGNRHPAGAGDSCR